MVGATAAVRNFSPFLAPLVEKRIHHVCMVRRCLHVEGTKVGNTVRWNVVSLHKFFPPPSIDLILLFVVNF